MPNQPAPDDAVSTFVPRAEEIEQALDLDHDRRRHEAQARHQAVLQRLNDAHGSKDRADMVSLKELGNVLGITAGAVGYRARRLGISGIRGPKSIKLYTEEEALRIIQL